jgi:hypothetical protein
MQVIVRRGFAALVTGCHGGTLLAKLGRGNCVSLCEFFASELSFFKERESYA